MWKRLVIVAVLAASTSATVSARQVPTLDREPVKLALVIGVSDYSRDRAALVAQGFRVPSSLTNALSDAMLVGGALEQQGFKVTRVSDPDRTMLKTAVDTFADDVRAKANRFAGDRSAIGPDVIAVVYFSGHGAQGRPALERDIDNYLIPGGPG